MTSVNVPNPPLATTSAEFDWLDAVVKRAQLRECQGTAHRIVNMGVQLTDEQQAAVDAFEAVHAGRRRRLSIGGLAGTGKTTIIREICECFDGVAVAAPTGKAAHVLRSKGVEHAQTLHSLLYRPRSSRDGEVEFYLQPGRPCRVLIVDEASMLTSQIVKDVEYKVRHVAYFGDHGQLEPVGPKSNDPGIMREPDIRLEQIHRQASDSPILPFAYHLRQGGRPRSGGGVRVQRGGSADLANFDVVLCGFNTMRQETNAWIRRRRGYSGKLPQPGENVICLRNNAEAQVWNGMTATVEDISPATNTMSVLTDDGPRTVLFDSRQFGAAETLPYKKPHNGRPVKTLWDFGYALTVHKSQGSQWDRVAVYEQISSSWSASRWRYTAATRAAKELRWVLPKRKG